MRTLGISVLAASGVVLSAAAAPASAPMASTQSGSQCTPASYTQMRGITSYHRSADLIYVHRVTVGSHSKRAVSWSKPASSRVSAHIRPSGSRTSTAWLWRRVDHHYGQGVATAGERSSTTATSGSGKFTLRNSTARVQHDIEFNGFGRFHGRYFTTRCAHPGPAGVGQVKRSSGAWVTFGKAPAIGVVTCGAGSAGSAFVRAALKHCR